MVWLETPSNPLLRLTDLSAVVPAAHAVGAVVVADNTFASPVVQRPLEYGVDVVVHSATKYLSGHSDVVAGVIVAADAEVGGQLCWWANALGATAGAFDSYLALRGPADAAPQGRRSPDGGGGSGRPARVASERPGLALPGAGVPPAARPGRPPAGRVRRHRHLRARQFVPLSTHCWTG